MTEPVTQPIPSEGPPIQGVIFDLDGTLYSLRWLKLRMARRLWRNLSLLRKLSKARKSLRNQRYDNHAQLRGALYGRLASLTGLDTTRIEKWYLQEFYPAFLETLRSAKHRSGILEYLQTARANGIKTAVVSDFGLVDQRLRSLRIAPDLFDDLLSSEELGCLKPSPEPIEMLAQKWQIPPANICVVGDRLDLDGEFARNAGARFLGIADSKIGSAKKVGFVSWRAGLRLLENGRVSGPVMTDTEQNHPH